MPYAIEVLRDQCITAETCVAEAPTTFEIDDEGIAIIINPTGDDDDAVYAAAESCPVECVILRDAAGAQVFPEA